MNEDDGDPGRLTPDELAFLQRHPAEQAKRAERNSRGNARRTERRHGDPVYAERLRLADRERQRRRRAKAAIGRPEPEPEAPVNLPPLSEEEAMHRLETHLAAGATPQGIQLRRRPDLLRRYVACFVAYRTIALSTGRRPARGELSAVLSSRFGLQLTSAQIQKLRAHVEQFATGGGPWQAR